MPLTEQDLTDLEIADSVGDFGRDSKVSDVVDELRERRTQVAQLEQSVALRGQENDALRALVDELRAGRVADLESYKEAERDALAERPVTLVVGGGHGGNAGGATSSADPLTTDERARRTRLAWWADLTDGERAELLNLCCYTCGALNPSCRCGDDS